MLTNVLANKKSFSFQTEGFGALEMKWVVPRIGKYKIVYKDSQGRTQKSEIKVEKNRFLQVNPNNLKNSNTTVDIKYIGN